METTGGPSSGSHTSVSKTIASKGMIVHSAGPVDGGWGVIDFWESRDAFDRFVGARLMPRLQGLGDRGFPNPPDVKEFPVHNLETP